MPPNFYGFAQPATSLAAIAFFDLLSDAIEPISVIAQVTQLLWLATQRLAQ
jgi:hypothetical protein